MLKGEQKRKVVTYRNMTDLNSTNDYINMTRLNSAIKENFKCKLKSKKIVLHGQSVCEQVSGFSHRKQSLYIR